MRTVLEEISSGKSLESFKTLFKNELPLNGWPFCQNVEGKIESIDVARTKFILHWERGVEMITKEDQGEDWIFLIHKLMAPTLTPNG